MSRLLTSNIVRQSITNKYAPISGALQQRKFTDVLIVGAAATTATVGFGLSCLRVAKSNEYIVRTGMFLDKDIETSKWALALPIVQKADVIRMTPTDYHINIQAMSSEMLKFLLPGTLTIGPKDDKEALVKYARYLLGDQHISEKIIGIIEGEVRVTAANMAIKEIFDNRESFKWKVIDKIQNELEKLGLELYNANIKELDDIEGSRYFTELRKKTTSQVEGQALVDIARAKNSAIMGEKERETEARMRVAELEANAVEKENDTRIKIAESEAKLKVAQAEAYQRASIADTEAEQRIETARIEQEIEKLRANDLTKIRVGAEGRIKDAEGDAESIRIRADADLYNEKLKAQGILAKLDAQAEGLKKMVESFDGSKSDLLKYLMIRERIYQELAKENAAAIQGLEPKITIWNTGSGENSDYGDVIRNIGRTIPPLMSTIEEQTGLTVADHLFKGKKN